METIKRSRWRSCEIRDILEIIKSKHIMNLLDGKLKRNKQIFESVAVDMQEKCYEKSADQIRLKFKTLKGEYFKIKRQNNKSGAGRIDFEFYDILNEILEHRPLATLSGVDTAERSYSPNSLLDETFSSVNETATISNETPNENETPFKVFKESRKRSYQNVIGKFTDEWKVMQEDLVKRMKEQEDNLIEKLKSSDEANMKALDLILEKDRNECAKMFSKILSDKSL